MDNLLEEQALDIKYSLLYQAGTPRRNSFQNRRTGFSTKVNLKKEQGIDTIPPDL
jgi:hypothetical protein